MVDYSCSSFFSWSGKRCCVTLAKGIFVLTLAILLVLLIKPGVSFTAMVDPRVSFQDENLEAIVREELGAEQDEDIYREDMEEIISLVAEDQSIKDITGLGAAGSLEELYLGGNKINCISPLTGLEHLNELDLSNNNIYKPEPLTTLDGLQELDVENNFIDTSSGSKDMEVINELKDNGVEVKHESQKDLSKRVLKIPDENLESALLSSLGKGQDEGVTVGDMEGLTCFEAVDKNIKDITKLRYAKNLEYLNLKRNQIRDLEPVSKLDHLEELNLEHNNVNNNDIEPIHGLEQLRKLDLRSNNIGYFIVLKDLDNLEELYLGFNNIKYIKSLSNLSNLKHLNLRYNRVSNISPLSDLDRLEVVDLHNNEIEGMIGGLPGLENLKKVDIEENYIDTDPGSSSMEIIEDLKDEGVDIKYETQDKVPSQDIQISLSSIDISEFPRVNTYASVSTFDGPLQKELTSDNFEVTERSELENRAVEQRVDTTRVKEVDNLAVALAIDRSGSMRGDMADAREAAKSITENLTAEDRGAVISYASSVTVDQEFTGDNSDLVDAIEPLSAGGWTALYDAVCESIEMASEEVGIPAVLAFTDGRDNRSSCCEDDVIDLARSKGVPVYTIGLGNVDEDVLERIADETGGGYYYTPCSSKLEEIYQELSRSLRDQYLLTYWTHNPQVDDTERTVEASVYMDQGIATDSITYTVGETPEISLTEETRALLYDQQPAKKVINIEAEITSSIGVESARLFCRTTGSEASYRQVSMSRDGSVFSGEIPSAWVNDPGVDFYITATDGTQTVSSPGDRPAEYAYQIPVFPNERPRIDHEPVETALPNSVIEIAADISEDKFEGPIGEVKLYYRPVGAVLYDSVEMQYIDSYDGEIATYEGQIDTYEGEVELSEEDIEYFIEATDIHGVRSYDGSKNRPYIIDVLVDYEEVNIPDKNLRKAVKSALDMEAGDKITEIEMEELTSLDAEDKNIKDLTGMEYAINLEELKLSENKINEVDPLVDLENLENINLFENEICAVEIEKLSDINNLTRLNLGKNNISDIEPFSGMEQLERLVLYYNDIKDLEPLADLDNLESLWLAVNEISDIEPLSNLDKLEALQLGSNDISDIESLADLNRLETLYLGSNDISDIEPLSGLDKLEWLTLSDNNISDIDLLSDFDKLERLSLGRNEISDIEPLADLDKLEWLTLYDNEINDINPLDSLKKLEILSISSNQINYAGPLAELPKLKTLRISSNNLICIEALSGLENLEVVELRNNYIDISSGSDAISTINELKANDVSVDYKPQKVEDHSEVVFDLDVGLDWDPDQHDSDEDEFDTDGVEKFLEDLGLLVYKLTEGRQVIGNLEVYTEGENFNDTDIQILSEAGRSNATLGGINDCSLKELLTGKGRIKIYTATGSGKRTPKFVGQTIAHELGHYAYTLMDEYEGQEEPGSLEELLGYGPFKGDKAVDTIMNYHWEYDRFSVKEDYESFEDKGHENAQWRVYGESAWETLASNPLGDNLKSLHAAQFTRKRYEPFEEMEAPEHVSDLNKPEEGWDAQFNIEWMDGIGALTGGEVTLAEEVVEASENEPVLFESTVSPMEKRAWFYAESDNNKDFNFNLTTPDGDTITPDSLPEKVEYEVKENQVIYTVKDPEPGNWESKLSGISSETDKISHKVTAESFLYVDLIVKGAETYPEPIDIMACVYGPQPVVGADVEVVVTKPGGSQKRIPLRDDGTPPDLLKNDGIYSGVLGDYTEAGEYTFEVYVSNPKGEARLDTGGALEKGEDAEPELLEPFTRTATTTIEVPEIKETPFSPQKAQRIEPDNSRTWGALKDSSDELWYKFDAGANTHYYIQTGRLLSFDQQEMATNIELYGADAETKLEVSENYKERNVSSSLEWTAPEDDTYYIKVTNPEAGTGSFVITAGEENLKRTESYESEKVDFNITPEELVLDVGDKERINLEAIEPVDDYVVDYEITGKEVVTVTEAVYQEHSSVPEVIYEVSAESEGSAGIIFHVSADGYQASEETVEVTVEKEADPEPRRGGGSPPPLPDPDPVIEPEDPQVTPKDINRLYGSDRYETAVEISRESFPEEGSAQAVVLARGDEYPDALAGVPLAYERGAPLLLTPTEKLHPAAAGEIKRVLQPGETVYVLGGTAAVSDAIVEELRRDYEVKRISGKNRYETATNIAEALAGGPKEVFLTTGQNYPDAVAVSSAAAERGAPVLLTRTDELIGETSEYLEAHQGSINEINVIGGTAAVSNLVYHEAGGTRRVAGADRWETAAEVAETFFEEPTNLTLATGDDFPDALTGGAYAATREAPVLLSRTGELPQGIIEYFNSLPPDMESVSVFGGTNAVSEEVLEKIKDSLE